MRYALENKLLHAVLAGACLVALVVVGSAGAETASDSGGMAFVPPPPPPKKAKIAADGKVIAPRSAPRRVRRVIRAANRLIGKPYHYGGGHSGFRPLDSGYDCSGSVSYALYGGRFLHRPMDSSELMSWGRGRPGRWITVYSNSGHAYVVVAGLRFDTGMRDDPSHTGPAWSRHLRRSDSYVARHPRGY